MDYIIKEVEGLFKIIKLKEFRRTEGVVFDVMTKSMVPKIHAVDRVLHKSNATSPGAVGGVERPWYMHTHQEDNLFVLQGVRFVELYSVEHGKVEEFIVTPDRIEHNGEVVIEGGAVLIWPTHVFHRVQSAEEGSSSINLATHLDGIDMQTNFNIYDLDVETGEYHVIRAGYEDQK